MSNSRAGTGPNTAEINERYFRDKLQGNLVENSPHLKHASLRQMCDARVRETQRRIAATAKAPKVLDMGAGDGALTLRYLEAGARVTAADATPELLSDLKRKGEKHGNALDLMPGDIFATLARLAGNGSQFDIISASSFLHHIPDYLQLLRLALPLLSAHGIFFTFQDPVRYDTLGRGTYFFDRLAYFGWRMFQGNYARGLKTRWRRLRGIYRDDLAADTAEYHVVRGGVDHLAIADLLSRAGLQCEVFLYWSAHSTFFQKLGERWKLANTFGVLAQRQVI